MLLKGKIMEFEIKYITTYISFQDYILFNELEPNSENNNNNFDLKYHLKNKKSSKY